MLTLTVSNSSTIKEAFHGDFFYQGNLGVGGSFELCVGKLKFL